MSKTSTVYISSTFTDLRVHRRAVMEATRRMGLRVEAMEDYAAAEEPPVEKCLEVLSASDFVVLIVGWRYGYVPAGYDKSLVELEYEAARNRNIPVFAFLLSDDTPVRRQDVDSGPSAERIRAFRDKLHHSLLVSFFSTPDDLAIKVLATIAHYMGVTTPPSLDAAPENEVTLATVLKEIKSVRSEVSALQQLVLQSGVTRSYPPPNQELNGFQPAPFLGPLADGIDPSQCFVIMPYSERWSKALEQILSEICRNESVKLSIAKNMDNRFIPHDIWRGITGSGLIIADLSGANPNVTYEVGLADVIGREVILIAQDKNVPFDFLAQRLILYEDSMAGMITLREELTKRLRAYNDTHRSDRQS